MDKLIKRESFIKNFIITILLILILIVEGCFNFVEVGWKWQRLGDVAFWVDISTSVLLLILIRVLSILIIQPIVEKHNMDLFYQKKRNEKLMLARGNNIDAWTFWIDMIKNVLIRKEKHLEIINHKLSKLNYWAKDNDRALWYDKSEDKEIYKKNNKYCQKRKFLELQTSDEWIEENLNTIKVKGAAKLNAHAFDLPIASNIKENKYKIKGATKQTIAIAVLLAVIMMLFVNVLKRTLDYATNETLFLTLFINILIDIVLMGGQVISGWLDSIKIVNNEMLLPYVNRNNILIEYIYYKNTDKDKVKAAILAIDTESKELTNKEFNKG